jgi:hypothetical protein
LERRDGITIQLAATGDPAPGTGGGAFGVFLRSVGSGPGGLGGHGWSGVTATLTGGSGNRGIFVFGAPQVPALAGPGWALLALGLAATGVALSRARVG